MNSLAVYHILEIPRLKISPGFCKKLRRAYFVLFRLSKYHVEINYSLKGTT